MKAPPQWKLLFGIFWSFFKISPVTFGGGYAMIPFIEREVVERRGWIRSKDIADVFAVSESVPGAIALNSATFVGYRIAGIPGAIAALCGVLFPAFLIVTGLCIAFIEFQDHPKVMAAFKGIRAATVALIVYAGFKIARTAVVDKTTLLTVALTVLLMLWSHLNPILLIMLGAVLGIVFVRIKIKLGYEVPIEKEEEEEAKPVVQVQYKYTDYYLGDGI
ncbi:chromate transporter [Paenibacillus hamazuiensis]|uniref:chromate transporter n=1 Tax=Paenibacillus hamazuiensis TaxID=2936508 RepID=UPI00200F27C1|nr:chromate transporter [Paenibacillus hamazuiensis]